MLAKNNSITRRLSLCLFSFLIFSLIYCGCNRSAKNSLEIISSVPFNNMSNVKSPRVDDNNISFSINVIESHDDNKDEFYDMFDYLSFKKIDDSDNTISIEATSKYYDQYSRGERIIAPIINTSEPFNYRTYLNLGVYIVNNSNERLDIEELDFNVKKSKIDSIPYIFIYTSDILCDMIAFSNESHFDWSGFTFYYTVLKKNETFNGEYANKRHVDYFEDYKIIDLLDDFIKMGFDPKSVMESQNLPDGTPYDYSLYEEDTEGLEEDAVDVDGDDYAIREVCLYAYTKEDSVKYARVFYPFEFIKRYSDEIVDCDTLRYPYQGYAKLYGKLVFDNYDNDVSFCADVVLSVPCGGASYEEEDHFDVKLKPQGENYVLRYPYTTVIEPLGMEMITISVNVEKSSNHEFYVSLINNNNINICSKKILLHYMAPKHYYESNR